MSETRCKQALELTCLFAITTPDMYPQPTVNTAKVHSRGCKPCTEYLNSLGVRHAKCPCSFCRPYATPVLSALIAATKPG